MYLNTDKTKVMLITTSEKRLHLNDCVLKLTYNRDILKNIKNDKVLRVLIDNNLTWSFHMQSIAKKKSHNLWLISKLKDYFSLENRESKILKDLYLTSHRKLLHSMERNFSLEPRHNLQTTKRAKFTCKFSKSIAPYYINNMLPLRTVNETVLSLRSVNASNLQTQ